MSNKFRDTTGVGYAGWLALQKGSGPVMGIPVLAGSKFDPTPSVIGTDDLVHGANNDYAAYSMSYAEGVKSYEGSISSYLFLDLWGDLWEQWAVSDRCAVDVKAAYSPDGTLDNLQEYSQVLLRNLTIDAASGGAPGSPVTFNVSMLGIPTVDSGINQTSDMYDAIETGCDGIGKSPVPYYRTEVDYAGFESVSGEVLKAVSWSLSLNNQTFVTYLCNNSTDPTYIQQGLMLVEGNCVLYHPSGVKRPKNSHEIEGCPPLYVYIYNATGTEKVITFEVPIVVFESYDHPIVAPNQPVTRTCKFKAFGTIDKKPIVITNNL